MPPSEDEDAIQALSAQPPREPFRERVRTWCPDRCADDGDALGDKDLVEGACAFRVASRMRKRIEEDSQLPTRLRACWATHSRSGLQVTPARGTRRVPISMKKRTKRRRRNTVSTVTKSQARMPTPGRTRTASAQTRPPRRGGRSRPGGGSPPRCWARSSSQCS